MNCPKCNVLLVMSERQGIEIDYCPQCRGIWLDRGELDKIIERSATRSHSAESSFGNLSGNDHHRSNEHYDQTGHYKHKKKGWLGELFD